MKENKEIKGEVKKGKKLYSKRVRHILKAFFAAAVLAMMAYGLVYAPMRQLEVAQGNLLISNQAIQLAEAKDIKKCQSLAQQQLALAIDAAKKEDKEVSDEDKEKYANSIYLNCLSFEARDYIVNAAVEDAKKTETAKTTETTEDKK